MLAAEEGEYLGSTKSLDFINSHQEVGVNIGQSDILVGSNRE